MISKEHINLFVLSLTLFLSLNFITQMASFSYLLPVIIAVWLASLDIFIKYMKIPTTDPSISHSVIYADWKTGGNKIPIIGHAGGSYDAPGNTLECFREAAKNGADGVEFDLQMTKDNFGVLLHDDSIDAVTNGSGFVSEMTYEELSQYDPSVKHIYHEKFKHSKIPTFEQAIQECLKLDLVMYVDVKSTSPQTLSLVLETFKKYKLHKKAVVSAFNPMFLYKIKVADNNIITVQLMRPYVTSYDGIMNDAKPRFKSILQLYKAILIDKLLEWSVNSWLWQITGISAVSLHHQYLSEYVIDQWNALGIEVIAWTVNDKTKKEFLLKTGVPIITDSIK